VRYVYLHGFASGPSSRKAQYFASRFRECGISLEIPDLAQGDFEHLTITGQLAVIDQLLGGDPACLIGSSMGGYLSALYAARHSKVNRVVLLAPAFGFARRWPEALGEEVYLTWKTTGWLPFFHYVDNLDRRVHYELIEDGLRYEDYPEVSQPCLVFHGTDDAVVPVEFSEEFARRNSSAVLRVVDSGHELTDQLETLWTESRSFLLD
jgi:pimeloyl-ACP methyl ester carboxylesterase